MNKGWRVRLLVSGFMVLGCYGLWSLWQLPIRTIRMDGHALSVAQQTQLMQMFAPWQGSRFFQADLTRWQTRVTEMPWVKTATIRRQWPATILLSVQPHQYLAQWYPEGVITTTGEYLNLHVNTPLPLTLEGPPGMQATLFRQYQNFQARLSEQGLTLTRLTLEPRGAWEFMLDNGCLVKLGRSALMERLERWLAVHEQLMRSSTRTLAVIDLRYVNGMALQYE